jgi:REP element-mobilizing transposase RayT
VDQRGGRPQLSRDRAAGAAPARRASTEPGTTSGTEPGTTSGTVSGTEPGTVPESVPEPLTGVALSFPFRHALCKRRHAKRPYGELMPRRLRVAYNGAIYHITMRGNRRQIVFFTRRDFLSFESLLKKVAERDGWDIFAACVLDNHYHLVLRTREANIADGMRYLNSMYARMFNYRHGLTGHVFQRRYFSEVIEDDDQLRETIRYVMLNPVRAGLSLRPEQWQWSTCAASLGAVQPRLPLDMTMLRELFGSVQALENYLAEGIVPLPTAAPWR